VLGTDAAAVHVIWYRPWPSVGDGSISKPHTHRPCMEEGADFIHILV